MYIRMYHCMCNKQMYIRTYTYACTVFCHALNIRMYVCTYVQVCRHMAFCHVHTVGVLILSLLPGLLHLLYLCYYVRSWVKRNWIRWRSSCLCGRTSDMTWSGWECWQNWSAGERNKNANWWVFSTLSETSLWQHFQSGKSLCNNICACFVGTIIAPNTYVHTVKPL